MHLNARVLTSTMVLLYWAPIRQVFTITEMRSYRCTLQAKSNGNERYFAPETDSVVLSYVNTRWHGDSPYRAIDDGWPSIPDSFLHRGKCSKLRLKLGSLVNVYDVPTEDSIVKKLGGVRPIRAYALRTDENHAGYWKDRHGNRLILFFEDLFHGGSGQVILSSVSRHMASPVDQDWRATQTDEGIGLGSSVGALYKKMGKPTDKANHRGFVIHSFMEYPQVVKDGKRVYAEGAFALFVTKKGKVVEIWLSLWTNEPAG